MCNRPRASAGAPCRRSRLLRFDGRSQTKRYQFQFTFGIAVAVTALVLKPKVANKVASVRNVEFVSLASIANVDADLMADLSLPALSAEVGFGLAVQPGKLLFGDAPPER